MMRVSCSSLVILGFLLICLEQCEAKTVILKPVWVTQNRHESLPLGRNMKNIDSDRGEPRFVMTAGAAGLAGLKGFLLGVKKGTVAGAGTATLAIAGIEALNTSNIDFSMFNPSNYNWSGIASEVSIPVASLSINSVKPTDLNWTAISNTFTVPTLDLSSLSSLGSLNLSALTPNLNFASMIPSFDLSALASNFNISALTPSFDLSALATNLNSMASNINFTALTPQIDLSSLANLQTNLNLNSLTSAFNIGSLTNLLSPSSSSSSSTSSTSSLPVCIVTRNARSLELTPEEKEANKPEVILSPREARRNRYNRNRLRRPQIYRDAVEDNDGDDYGSQNGHISDNGNDNYDDLQQDRIQQGTNTGSGSQTAAGHGTGTATVTQTVTRTGSGPGNRGTVNCIFVKGRDAGGIDLGRQAGSIPIFLVEQPAQVAKTQTLKQPQTPKQPHISQRRKKTPPKRKNIRKPNGRLSNKNRNY